MASQRELLNTLRATLASRRTQAQELLEEAHVSERVERRRRALQQEERELVAQLEAMESLIKQGRQRLRAAEASASQAHASGGSVAEVLESGSGAYGDSFETDAPSVEEEMSGGRLGGSGSRGAGGLVGSRAASSMVVPEEEASIASEISDEASAVARTTATRPTRSTSAFTSVRESGSGSGRGRPGAAPLSSSGSIPVDAEASAVIDESDADDRERGHAAQRGRRGRRRCHRVGRRGAPARHSLPAGAAPPADRTPRSNRPRRQSPRCGATARLGADAAMRRRPLRAARRRAAGCQWTTA